MKASEIDQIVRVLEKRWKDTRRMLNQQEKAVIETYVSFLRTVARTCLERGCRVWFKPNQVVHWGEGGFGWLSVLCSTGEPKEVPDLAGEVRFLADLSDKRTLGEEITLTTLERITHETDQWH